MAAAQTEQRLHRRRCGAAFVILALAALSAGCSTERIFGSSSAPASGSASQASTPGSTSGGSSSITDQLTNFFKPQRPAATASGEPFFANPLDLACPPVDIRQGASTLTVPPGATDAFSLRYQGSIGEMARECKVADGVMTMKVGVQGRILIGPSGGPGMLEVPLRYAVVREGPEPKVVASKFYKIPVTIPEGKPNVVFTHIDEDVSFPQPSAEDINAYVVYVGFDPMGERPPPAKKPAPKPRTPARAR